MKVEREVTGWAQFRDPEPAHGYTNTPFFKPITVSAEELRTTPPLDLMWWLMGGP